MVDACPDRFRERLDLLGEHHEFAEDLSTTLGTLTWRRELDAVCESAAEPVAAFADNSLRERLAARGEPVGDITGPFPKSELRIRLRSCFQAKALTRIARAEMAGQKGAAAKLKIAQEDDTPVAALKTLIIGIRRQKCREGGASPSASPPASPVASPPSLPPMRRKAAKAKKTPQRPRTTSPTKSPARTWSDSALTLSVARPWKPFQHLVDGHDNLNSSGHQLAPEEAKDTALPRLPTHAFALEHTRSSGVPAVHRFSSTIDEVRAGRIQVRALPAVSQKPGRKV